MEKWEMAREGKGKRIHRDVENFCRFSTARCKKKVFPQPVQNFPREMWKKGMQKRN